ncbi:fibronectin type III domain-containing protein [Flavobacterium sp. AS60]|uniref:fibronectin type III domain-containing protein n=1 Tax=Flavobacterium anseongense TaxID=2910677 RepID=UPI001F40B13E|nr:fibronectin type III domain-containing protein [Flavobacterium sp. AS60]MCF6128632.1 fibronectin type III domain-containing protein [Flavobacterium sp. AS60]
MKKITLLLLFLFFSISGYSQLALEGFENTTGPDVPPSTNWTLGTGNWAVFDTSGSSVNWEINSASTSPPTVYNGVNAAYVNRENIGAGNTSEEYLATPPVQIPTNGVLHFYTRMFTSGNQGTIYQIKVASVATGSQTNPNDYVLVQQWSEDELITPTSNFNIYTEKTVDLGTAFAGQFVYVAFVKVFTQPDGNIGGDRWLIDDVSIDAQCLTPTGLASSVITANGATLNWTNPNGPVNGWEIEVVLASGTPTGVATHTTTTFPYVVTGLLPNTAYKFYVRAICTTGFSSPWSVASPNFTTLVAPPVCGGNFVDSGGIGGNYSNNENLTTTICPVNTGDLVTVTFTAFNVQNNTDFLRVYDGPDATAPLLASLTGTALPPAITASSASGCLTFVFTSNGTTTASGWASNVTCNPPPACRIPTALTSNTITTNSVILGWTQPANPDTSVATAWQVLALPCGSLPPTAGSTGYVDATSNPFTLTGLTPATCYNIYVRAVCSGPTTSGWTAVPATITTQLAPPVCGGNFVDTGGLTANYPNNANQTTTICPTNPGDVVTVTFTAFNTQLNTDFLKIYDGDDATATLLANLSGTTLPPSFTSSAASGCLTFVFTSNGTTNAAGWVANITCAAPPTCRPPTALASSAVLSTSVTLNWVQPANPDASVATSWEVLALPCGSPAPDAASTGFVTATTNPFTLTGLTPNTCYAIYVRAVCSPLPSTWSGPVTITTQIAPPACGGNFYDPAGPTANYTNNLDSTVTICPTTPGEVVTVTFSAFNTEATWDGLYVFNGNSITSPQIASANGAGNVPGGLAGSYWGTVIPGPFTSSSVDGCLTFRFRTDGSGTFAGWAASVTCAPPPTCIAPTAITNNTVTSNSVTLNWTQPVNPDSSVASAWQVLALPCGSPAPDASATGYVDVTTNPFTLTGLTPATCYNVYIRAVCSSTDRSTWGGPTTFTTQVAPPVCGGNFVDAGGPTANYPNNSDSTVTICPTTPGDVVTVTFSAFNTEANWDGLYVFDGNSIAAPQIASANPAANVPGGLAGSYWGTVIPGPFTSTSADGCLTFRFRSDGSINNPGWVSTITCAPPATCRTPTAITSANITHNSVVLNWTQPVNPDTSVASAWQVLALPCGSPLPDAASTGFVDVTSNPFTLTGLTPSTCYDIYIRAVCSVTDISTWGGPRTITTLVAPPVCGGTFVDAGGPSGNYANNSNITTIICPTNPGEIVTVTFTAFNTEANWDGLYVYDGNTVNPATQIASANPANNVPGGIPGSYWGTAIPGPFTSTSPEGCLTFVFRSDGSVNNPGWVANVTCSPAPTCARPTSLTATSVTQTSAVLSWTQLPNPDGSTATAWEILILPAGSPVPTGPGIPATSPYIANGLTAGTAYVFYVRAICSPTDASEWSAFNFAALPVNDECANATFAIVNQNLNCVQTTSGTLSGATASLPATTCGGAGAANDDVWFTFTATSITHIISFNNVTPATALSYAIYQGDCNGLTQVGCNSGAGLIAGATYYIRVFSTGTVPVFTNFDLCIGTLPCTEAPAFCTGQTVTYANSTDVPSLGQIGCLFTSPNPAFFFLQVNQAGPLSYLISQVDNGGTPRDVDYVAWGPFTDLNTACTGVPANPLAQTVPIPTPTTGCPGTLHACSYSTAPQEIMCIPNAQLCEVYVIMITNFSNQAGTVTFTQTNSGGGTTACFPINTFNYPSTYYCQNAANPTPVLAPGAVAGVYSSTAGLVIDPVTGTIDLLASTPGAYVVTSTSATTIGGVCSTIPFITTTRTVIITAPASATISYPATTYCNSITSPQSVLRNGTAGGTYSSTPAGLLLNVINGDIIPIASTPGLYTVTYTIPGTGGCPPFSTQTQVEILASPIVLQANVTACDTFTLPTLGVGNYYAAAGGVGTPLDVSVPLTSSQPVYIYAVGTNGCITERSFNVTINTVPAPTYTVTQSTCTTPSGSITVTSPVSAGNPPPADLFISEVTDADTGSLSYVEIYNGTGASVNLNNYKLKFYTWGTPPTAENFSCDLQLAGTLPNNSVHIVAVGSNTNQGGVVPDQVFAASCGGVNINDNIRLTTTAGVEIDLWGATDGSTFTPSNQTGYTYRRLNTSTVPSLSWNPADWTELDPEDYTNVGSYSYTVSNYQYSVDNGPFQTGTLFSNLAIGDHTLVVKDLSTGCFSAPVTVTVNPLNPITAVTGFSYTTPVCQNATPNPTPGGFATGFTTGGVYSEDPSTSGLVFVNTSTGEIDLVNSTTGLHTVNYTVANNPGLCLTGGQSSATIEIKPTIIPVIGFTYTTPICKNAQATLSPNLAAGFSSFATFSVTPSTGLAINSTTGIIDLANSTPGIYSIIVDVPADPASCRVSATTLTPFLLEIKPVVTLVTGFDYDTPFCANSGSELPNLDPGFTTGGIFSSTNGLIINPSTGAIDLTSTPGAYTVTYTATPNVSNCEVSTPGTTQVMIIPPVTIELTGGCQSVNYILTANGSFTPETATFSWHNAAGVEVGTQQSVTITEVGVYTVTVTVDGCSTDSMPFDVASVFCIIQKGISVNNDGLNDTFDLTGYDVKKLTIFNRLGMKVYSRNNYVNEWGGKSDDGDELPDGTYYFIIDRNNGENKTGWIYINRAQ